MRPPRGWGRRPGASGTPGTPPPRRRAGRRASSTDLHLDLVPPVPQPTSGAPGWGARLDVPGAVGGPGEELDPAGRARGHLDLGAEELRPAGARLALQRRAREG